MAVPVDALMLDPTAQGTLQSRIQQMVAQGILSGRFRRGEKLPSSRKLAAHLGVSRITVTLAYNELLANDYLTSRGRSGYFVSENAPDPPAFADREAAPDRIDWDRAIGQRFTGGASPAKPLDWQSYTYSFIYGQTDPTLFDHTNWRQCAMQALGVRNFAAMTADYYDRDDPELVQFVLRHTLPRRGIMAQPEQVLITLGAQNALWLAAQVLLTPGRRAAIEDPSYFALRDILRQTRADVVPVPVDAGGLPPDLIPDDTQVVFVTPSHHCPTSATMPLDRRRALLERAGALDALIVEDDYEFEMAFLHPPAPALKSLDDEGRVIHVGSFSKSLFPGLRLGYLVGSARFIDEARALRASVLRHPPGLIQRTAAQFLSLGHYDALIRRMAREYDARRRVMEAAIAEHGLTIAGTAAHGGSSFWMRAPDGVDAEVLARDLARRDVLIEPGATFFAEAPRPIEFYRIAYSSIPADRIPEGIARIAQAIAARQ
ncbi:PLP-dependent aminotransferase family protein [Pseudaestuariivita atlantica]|uniref:GntR family transcriptional regulator n=1 Tax=Pseudaestuariivita atlantica TaxID=1317121 RepID=A0A0L1JRG9_9RHOB|nr:PLP-dependent aminotransferase family protein [Pseudaestuariivita atlantica]KNG94345.1 GntR family transcriptional regulator [Pseudaestuariivita atlantica]